MPIDLIRYDLLAQQALRGLVRNVLADAAKNGLPGDHHFYITFDTRAEGVRLSPRLVEQYPEEMTIVLQHQFWDLKVSTETFEVGLSFGGVPERLLVPFEAITGFRDPSVQFALQFEDAEATPEAAAAKPAKPAADADVDNPPSKPKSRARPPARQEAVRTSVPATPLAKPDGPPEAAKPAGTPDDGAPDKPGGQVVRLDRFRKK
jgi:hypothetical protein